MGTISSTIEDIAKLYIEPIPLGKSIDIVKFCQIDNIITIVDVEGNIFSNAIKNIYMYSSSHDTRIELMVKCCSKMGLLSDAALKEFKEDQQRKVELDKHEWAVSNLRLYADELGIKLTAGQKAKLKLFDTTFKDDTNVSKKQES